MKTCWRGVLAVSLCAAMTIGNHAAQAAGPATGSAPAFPDKPIRIVVGFSPGGIADISARIVAEKLADAWKQQVMVDNRPGAGSVIGSQIVASSAPDGYTMLSVSAAHAAVPTLYAKLPFDSARDFAGVAMTCTGPLLLVATPSLGAKTAQDLIALAKARPGQFNFSSAGVGSATHFAMEFFKNKADIDIVHVPYKGVPEALTDTLTGRVHVFISPLINALPNVRDGKVIALGVTTARRSSLLPDVPAIADSGLPGYRWESWHGLLVPAQTPRAVVARLNAEIMRVLGQSDVRERIAALGLESPPNTPEQFDKFIRDEIAMYAQAARAAGIKAE